MQQHAVQRPSILNVVLPELVGEFVRILVPGIKKSRKTNSLSLKHEYFYGVLRNTINVLSGSSSHRLPSTCEFSVKSQWVSGTQIAMLRPLVGRELRCRCESWRGKCKLQDVNSVYCFYLERADGTKMSIQMGYKVEKVDPKFEDLFFGCTDPARRLCEGLRFDERLHRPSYLRQRIYEQFHVTWYLAMAGFTAKPYCTM